MIFKKVTEGIYRGSQPETKADYQKVLLLPVKTIMKLNEDREEEEWKFCTSNGIPMGGYPLSEWGRPSTTLLLENVEMVRNFPKPIFVHCLHGYERTGRVIAEYRIKVQGWSKWEAIKEALREGFSPLMLWWFL